MRQQVLSFFSGLLLIAAFTAAQTQPATRPIDGPDFEKTFRDLYDHLGKVYPCFEMKHIDWKNVGEELLPESKKITNPEDFGLLCLRLIARLQDSHAMLLTGIYDPPTPPDLPVYDPGFACLFDDRDRPVVYYVDPNGPAEAAGITVGMTITAIHGHLVDPAIERWMKLTSDYYGYSSERYLRYDAARGFMRVGTAGEAVKIEAEDAQGNPLELVVAARMPLRYLPRLPVPIEGIRDDGSVEFKDLGRGIGYVYVRRINDDLCEALDRAVAGLPNIKGLIIDVRGNSGGGFDESRAFRNFDSNDPAEPSRPRFTGPIALLLDERCISAGEGWSSWFIAKQRAKTFGSTTAGASSGKEDYPLINGYYKVLIPVKAYTGSLDRPIELKGLEPDVPVRCSAKDLAEKKDTVLETARNWLLNQK